MAIFTEFQRMPIIKAPDKWHRSRPASWIKAESGTAADAFNASTTSSGPCLPFAWMAIVLSAT